MNEDKLWGERKCLKIQMPQNSYIPGLLRSKPFVQYYVVCCDLVINIQYAAHRIEINIGYIVSICINKTFKVLVWFCVS